MNTPTAQSIDKKIDDTRSTMMVITWATAVIAMTFVYFVIDRFNGSSQNTIITVLMYLQLVYIGLAVPTIMSMGLKYMELLFQRYDHV